MAYDFNGSTQYLRLSSAPVTVAPLTIAAWGQVDVSTNGEYTLCSIDDFDYNVGGNSQEFTIEFGADAGSINPIAMAGSAGTNGFAIGATSLSTGTWYHFAGVFASSTSRTIYLNGSSDGSDTTSVTPTNVSDVGIGTTFKASAGSKFMNGKVGEIGIWNVALTVAEIGSLADGASPLFVRPQSLVFYAPVVRNLTNYKGAVLTNTGSSAVFAHPRIIYPRGYNGFVSPSVAAPPATSVKDIIQSGIIAFAR